MRDIEDAREIVEALGGYPQFAQAIDVPYRQAYGYVERNSIPAKHDLKLVTALSAVGSEISLLSLARWRARLTTKPTRSQNAMQPERAANKSRQVTSSSGGAR